MRSAASSRGDPPRICRGTRSEATAKQYQRNRPPACRLRKCHGGGQLGGRGGSELPPRRGAEGAESMSGCWMYSAGIGESVHLRFQLDLEPAGLALVEFLVRLDCVPDRLALAEQPAR